MHYLNDLTPMQNSRTPIQIWIKLNISSMHFIMIKLNYFNTVLACVGKAYNIEYYYNRYVISSCVYSMWIFQLLLHTIVRQVLVCSQQPDRVCT